jgi:hypothetical protein
MTWSWSIHMYMRRIIKPRIIISHLPYSNHAKDPHHGNTPPARGMETDQPRGGKLKRRRQLDDAKFHHGWRPSQFSPTPSARTPPLSTAVNGAPSACAALTESYIARSIVWSRTNGDWLGASTKLLHVSRPQIKRERAIISNSISSGQLCAIITHES